MKPLALPAPLDRRRWTFFAQLVANGAAQAISVAAAAWASRHAFDEWILGAAPFDGRGLAVGVVLLAAYAAVAALRMHERIAAERLGQSYVRALRVALFDRLGRLPPRRIHARGRGGHLLRFIGDLTAFRQWLSLGLARLAVAGVSLALILAALAFMAPFAAALLVPVFALGAAATYMLGPRTREAVRETRRRRARLAAVADEIIAAIATMQAFGQLKRERRRLARRSRGLGRAMRARARMLGALRAVSEATAGLAGIAILAGGALGMQAGKATPGEVVSAIAVLGLCLPMLRDLARVHEYWQGFAVARDNVRRFITETERLPSLARGRERLHCDAGAIEIEDLCVAGALAGVTASARGGQRVALIGGHGAGKTTLLAVIARLIDPDGGRVRVDGTDLLDCRLNSVRAMLGLVGPDFPLMRGTLEYNLRYRAPDAPDDELQRVLRLTGVEELVRAGSGGIAMRIAEGGTNLSAGARQRVALARALLGGPRILLLDPQQLDGASERVFDDVVASFPGTVLMVTHDLARARRADWIWHLERGTLVAQGCPRELLAPGERAHAALARRALRSVA